MCGIQNVTRKHGTYYYRRLVRLAGDKPFRLRFSLRTTSRRRAGLLAPALTLIAERLAMTMMANVAADCLTAEQRAEIYRRQMLAERDRLEAMHASLHIVPRDDHAEVDKALSLRLGASELAASDGVTKGTVDDFLVAHVDADDDDAPIMVLAWSDIARSIADEGAEAAAIARLAELGIEQSRLREVMARKVINQARLAAIAEFRAALVDPAASYPPVPAAGYLPTHPNPAGHASGQSIGLHAQSRPWSTMTPTEAVEKFFDHNPRTGGSDGSRRKKDKAWTPKTRDQFRLPALLLEQVMHGRPLATVTHDDLVELDRCFGRLHGPTFRKSDRQRAMTIIEIVAETEQKIEEVRRTAEAREKRAEKGLSAADDAPNLITERDLGLGISTTNRHWGFLRQLTRWFHQHQPLATLDFSAFIANDDRAPRDIRETYTKEEGRFLFGLPPWTGAKSITKRMAPGTVIIHDSWYWVPMICWYTGARRAEVCGLQLDEIVEVDGMWCFDIVANDARRLKTARSKRLTPIADEILRLGFLDYVKALGKAGEVMLFPELVLASGKGDMGNTFYSNYWTKIAKRLPFLERGQALQSFRHTAIDELKGSVIAPELRADLAGHKMDSQTEDRYSKAHLDLIKEAIGTIPKVTQHLHPRPTNLLPARLRAPRKARTKTSQ